MHSGSLSISGLQRVQQRSNQATSLPSLHSQCCQRRHASFQIRGSSQRQASTSHVCAAAAAESASAPSFPDTPVLPYRIGHGWDLHRLEEGYDLWLGGVKVEHTKGCVAHSDGDIILHSVTDAVTGALGLPDIGQLFPDNDPKWKGARSDVFVIEAVRLMRERGYEVGNADITVIAERPKLSPVKELIRNSVAELLGCSPGVINIKAKTHEKVDAVGEQRAIECHVVCLLYRKDT